MLNWGQKINTYTGGTFHGAGTEEKGEKKKPDKCQHPHLLLTEAEYEVMGPALHSHHQEFHTFPHHDGSS